MRIAVCDDFANERARLIPMLQEYCAAKGLSVAFDEYGSGEALLAAFAPGVFSLIFLDIYMDGLSGVETARALRSADPDSVVIFTTTSREHGADAFDVEAFHYLVKPIDKNKLFSVLGKWHDALCEMKTVTFKCGRALHQVRLRDILYVDVLGRNSTVHTSSGSFEASMPLSAVNELLPAREFCRPIRYCLAALRHMQAIHDDGVLMDNGEKLPLSRREKENLRQQLASYRLRALRGR